MKMRTLFIVVIVLLTIVSMGYGDVTEREPERISYNNEAAWMGCFTKPCSYQPLYASMMRSRYLFWHNTGFAGHRTYEFMGRTGDKTFDIKYKEFELGDDMSRDKTQKENIYHLYFTPNDLVQVGDASWDDNCDKTPLSKKAIYLKLIDLKNNSLTVQIIMPKCVDVSTLKFGMSYDNKF